MENLMWANPKPSMHFKKAVHALQEGKNGIVAPSFTPNITHNFTSNHFSVLTPSFNPNITTNLLHHNKGN